MELDIVMPQKVNAKVVRVHVKVCDSGSYELIDASGRVLGSREDYVPSFFPGKHFGDYLILDIDLESGQITNWNRPDPSQVVEAFSMGNSEQP